jgi:hypothetical protein
MRTELSLLLPGMALPRVLNWHHSRRQAHGNPLCQRVAYHGKSGV